MKCNLISCSNNNSKTQSVNIFDTRCDTAAENCAPCRLLHAFLVNIHMESDGDDNFRPPDEPGPSFRSAESARSHGGKRRGSGRKRQHEEGYKKARGTIWKTIALHKNVYDEWMALRETHKFKENSKFAEFLLQCARNLNVVVTSNAQSEIPSVVNTTYELGSSNERYLIWFYFNCCAILA